MFLRSRKRCFSFKVCVEIMFRLSKVPCPAGMFSLGGSTFNCTACRAGTACPYAASTPVACTGGKALVVQRTRPKKYISGTVFSERVFACITV